MRKKRARHEAGLRVAGARERGHASTVPAGRAGERDLPPCAEDAGYQVKRGPTNHWVSPSTNFTSPLMPQFWLNLASAPTRP